MLEAIQLTILVDKNKPSNVLESYTFSFKYSGSAGDVNRRLESLSLDPVGCIADMKTAQSARAGLEMIVRRLITLSAFLPTLPSTLGPVPPPRDTLTASRQAKPGNSSHLQR